MILQFHVLFMMMTFLLLKHTISIGANLMKKMGYQRKGLNINGERIVNPIKVEEFPCYVGFGYVKKEFGECSKTTNDQWMMRAYHNIPMTLRIP